mgnify:CR=1 FL=1
MPDIGGIPTYPSGLTGAELDEALRNIGLVEQNISVAQGYAEDAKQSAEDAKQWASTANTQVVSYTITVPTTGWTTGSLKWGDATYTRKCTVTAADATASPTLVQMEYAGGSYGAYCTVALLDTQDGSVVLWAAADPTTTCQIRVVEVRSNEQSG